MSKRKIICNDFKTNEIIKILREQTGLNQQEFAKLFGVSDTSIQNYEYGLRNYSFEMLLEFAKKNNLKITIESK